MNPERQKEINNHLIEEFYWNGTYPVYVDNRLVNISFERACMLAEEEIAHKLADCGTCGVAVVCWSRKQTEATPVGWASTPQLLT